MHLVKVLFLVEVDFDIPKVIHGLFLHLSFFGNPFKRARNI